MTSIYVHVASLEQPELRGFEELDGYGPQDRNTGQESEVPNTEKKTRVPNTPQQQRQLRATTLPTLLFFSVSSIEFNTNLWCLFA